MVGDQRTPGSKCGLRLSASLALCQHQARPVACGPLSPESSSCPSRAPPWLGRVHVQPGQPSRGLPAGVTSWLQGLAEEGPSLPQHFLVQLFLPAGHLGTGESSGGWPRASAPRTL